MLKLLKYNIARSFKLEQGQEAHVYVCRDVCDHVLVQLCVYVQSFFFLLCAFFMFSFDNIS